MSSRNASILNTTSTALSANGTFTGQWEDVSRYETIRIVALSDKASSVNGVTLQFGIVNTTAPYVTKTYTSVANVPLHIVTPRVGSFFRVVWTNGATAQTTFALCSFWSEVQGSAQLSDTLTDVSEVLPTRAMVTARHQTQKYGPMLIDEHSALCVTQERTYNRLMTSTSVPVIQVNYSYAIHPDLNVTSVTGSGSVGHLNGRAIVSTGTSAPSSATLYTDDYCRCCAGDSITAMVACAFGTPRSGTIQIAGGGTIANGVFVGYLGTTFGVMIRSAGIDTWTTASNFNLDPVDGTGKSGITLNPLIGNTYAIRYDSVGFGSVTFMLVRPRNCVHMHTIITSGTALLLANPQFPCTAYCSSTTPGADVSIAVASHSAFTELGLYPPASVQRAYTAVKITDTTTNTLMLAIRNKDMFKGQINTSTIILRAMSLTLSFQGYSIKEDKSCCFVSVLEFPTVTGAVYTDIDVGKSVVEVSNVQGMTYTGGNLVYSTAVPELARSEISFTDAQHVALSPGRTIGIVCRLATASTYALCATLSWYEYQ